MELLVKDLYAPAAKSFRQLNGKLGEKIVRVMKLTVIILTAFCLHVSAGTKAQNVSISVKNASLESVFKEIKKQTNFTFFAKADLLDKGKSVTIQLRNVPLKEALDECFKDQPFTYSIEGRIITIEPKSNTSINVPPAITGNVAAVYRPITGQVLSSEGQPLADASVKVKGSKTGTTTDAKGRFTINANEGDVLIISFVGFTEISVPVTAASFSNADGIAVKLSPSVSALEETVVKGYYKSNKKASTGSVSTITGEKIANQPVVDPISAMQGRASGLMITPQSGMPGSSFQVVSGEKIQ
jgi:hypothetical protein